MPRLPANISTMKPPPMLRRPPAACRVVESTPRATGPSMKTSWMIGSSTRKPSAYMCWKPWPVMIVPATRFGFVTMTPSAAVAVLAIGPPDGLLGRLTGRGYRSTWEHLRQKLPVWVMSGGNSARRSPTSACACAPRRCCPSRGRCLRSAGNGTRRGGSRSRTSACGRPSVR